MPEYTIDPLFATLMVFVFGLLFGSFATMASYRIPRSEDLVVKPSRCPNCEHRLGFFDLFPVFTWLFARGKCRHCHVKIHWRYPATELAMALLFVVVYAKVGLTPHALSLYALVVCLVIMVVVDFEHQIIPDAIQIALIPVALWYHYTRGSPWPDYISGALLGLAIALGLRYGFWLWKKKEGLGIGDVKFFFVAGMFLGVKGFVPFMMLAGIVGVLISLVWKKMGKGEEFPFGPALGMSLFLCILFPEYTIRVFYLAG